MRGRRFLLMHVTTSTGHYRASCAIRDTLTHLDPLAHVVSVDAFQYTSRFVRWAISHTYSSLIRHQPDVWEYLYDNPNVHRRIRYFQTLLHRYQAAKFQRLLDTVRPDAIACTQAFPCGMAADFKKRHNLRIPLIGVLTDYAPHLYWFHDRVDVYVVPSESVKRRFMTRGIPASRTQVLGIPIDRRFLDPVEREPVARYFGLDPQQPILLIMGGLGGFGRIRDIVLSLDMLPYTCQLVVLAGTNRPLLAWVQGQRFRHHVLGLGYREDVDKLMGIATLLVSKPGGMTTTEALAKHLPLVIVNPIPGQEAYNARYLLSHGAAVQAGAPEMVRQTVRDLLDNPERLEALRTRNAELARPGASLEIARLLCELAATPAGRPDARERPAAATPAVSEQPV